MGWEDGGGRAHLEHFVQHVVEVGGDVDKAGVHVTHHLKGWVDAVGGAAHLLALLGGLLNRLQDRQLAPQQPRGKQMQRSQNRQERSVPPPSLQSSTLPPSTCVWTIPMYPSLRCCRQMWCSASTRRLMRERSLCGAQGRGSEHRVLSCALSLPPPSPHAV